MQPRKRILDVSIHTSFDSDGDTSYLGEYAQTRSSEYSIDRAHSLDCPMQFPLTDDGRIRIEHVFHVLEGSDLPEDELALETLDTIYNGELCNCEEHGDMRRGELRYFNPSFNYVDQHGKIRPDNTPEQVRQYVRQDYERMERLQRGDWGFVFVQARAVVSIPVNGYGIHTQQTVHSGGCGGLESDSDRAHMESIATEELAMLKDILHALGFSKRAISLAFKAVREVND